jgi:hypothetical protein
LRAFCWSLSDKKSRKGAIPGQYAIKREIVGKLFLGCYRQQDRILKKKPPPGATLIARLKEQRLAREAELARKQGADQGAVSPAENASPEPPITAVKADVKPVEPEIRTVEVELDAEPISTHEIVQPKAAGSSTAESVEVKHNQTPSATEPETKDLPGRRQTVLVSSNVRNASNAGTGLAAAASGDLLHREIDIDDLKPTTDDYFVLTDEIRLAGRFAAVGLIAQGLRLSRLREVQVYKGHYQTFEDYCRKEHQMSATYAYRLIRMAEMAERVAQLGQVEGATANEAMPDPFEVMIGLGHRHLMALLPLEAETAQELLVKGIPLPVEENGNTAERVPIGRATEKQIREALKGFSPAAAKTLVKVVEKKSLASEKQLIPALNKLVEMLEDWSLWLGGDPPPELQAARMGRGQLLNRLAKRFRAASGRIADALEGNEE